MKIQKEILNDFRIRYPLEKLVPLESVLFLDIETTGFAARSSHLYMIGCAYYQDDCWKTIQWLAENYDQESEILSAFFEFAGMYRYLIHFNGNNFDLPFLIQKCEMLQMPHCFDAFEGIDLYKRISPCKGLLRLPNCKQKTLEQFLGIERKDVFSGGELIGIYLDYIKNPAEFSEKSLFLHNSDDMKGMLDILPLLSYSEMLNGSGALRAKKVQANSYRDINGSSRKELVITASLPSALPRPVSASAEGCGFRAEGNEAVIRVPIYEGELKYFYSNYRDYYYLPAEDIALHRSVAGFVDSKHRIPASAANCYTRKQSSYLPQWAATFQPYFKPDYQSKKLFFELTDELKRDRAAFTDYASQIVQMIAASCG